jgi:hypothetical protein
VGRQVSSVVPKARVDVDGIQGGQCSFTGGDLKRCFFLCAGADSDLSRGGTDSVPFIHEVIEAQADLQWARPRVLHNDVHLVGLVQLGDFPEFLDGKGQRPLGDRVPVEGARRIRRPDGNKPQRD